MNMKCNVGKTDRIIRFVAGAAILVVGFISGSWLGLIGLIPVMTAMFRYCPAYEMLKISTDKR